MLDPPGTIRTPSFESSCFTGYVDLSNQGCRTVLMDMSTVTPMRKPIKIPFFTQVFTRQPILTDGSGSAARTSPAFNACLNFWKRWKCSLLYISGRWSNSCSISACMHAPAGHQPESLQNFFDPCEIRGAGRAHWQPPHRFQQSHQRHRSLHRNRIRLNAVQFHQRQEFALDLTRTSEIVGQRPLG